MKCKAVLFYFSMKLIWLKQNARITIIVKFETRRCFNLKSVFQKASNLIFKEQTILLYDF